MFLIIIFNDRVFNNRHEADMFYDELFAPHAAPEQRQLARQAYAGLLCTKQFYYYAVAEWMKGDPHLPPPPESRRGIRNADWEHLYNRDIISMPDKWE